MSALPERLVIGSEDWQRASACYVRFKVFVLERSISMEDEFDCLDTPDRVYSVLYLGKEPVSTGRFVAETSDTARLTRIATLREHRGKGYGRQIINSLEAYAAKQGFKKLHIHAELTAKSFYEELGYMACSEVYEEDGELCQSLQKELD